ncbi:hypothetical protein DFJ73DRAFT_36021 [Zopfochytrium polystomum]|nr:hypothetical protein DFJ73DRAFT_36021 [Zopfochytrium polystomum]
MMMMTVTAAVTATVSTTTATTTATSPAGGGRPRRQRRRRRRPPGLPSSRAATTTALALVLSQIAALACLAAIIIIVIVPLAPAAANKVWLPGNPLGDTTITFVHAYLKDADQTNMHDNEDWILRGTISYPDCMFYVRGSVPPQEVDLIVWNSVASGFPGCYIKKYDRMDTATIVWGGDMGCVLPGRYFEDSSYGPWYLNVTLNECANTCQNDGDRCSAAMYFANGSCIRKA